MLGVCMHSALEAKGNLFDSSSGITALIVPTMS